jgi:predicted transcriptional regulator
MFGRPHNLISESRRTESLPDLRSPPKYLKKKNDTSEFQQKLQYKLDEMTEKKHQIADRMAEVRDLIKQKQEHEHMIVSDRADKEKLKVLIPIYKEIRDLKKDLLDLHVNSQQLEKNMKRVSSQEKQITTRQEVLKMLNIQSPSSSKKPGLASPASTLRRIASGTTLRGLPNSSLISLIDKPVDKYRLNLVRMGLFREWLGVSMDARIHFSRKERIFPPIENIVKGQKQHLLDRSYRLKEVAQNRHEIDQMILNTRIERKLNKGAGIFTTARSSLYPFKEGKSFHRLDFSRIGSSTKPGDGLASQGSLGDLRSLSAQKSSYNILGSFRKD